MAQVIQFVPWFHNFKTSYNLLHIQLYMSINYIFYVFINY